MVANADILPKFTVDPQIERDAKLHTSVIAASGFIPLVFEERTGDFDFTWGVSAPDRNGRYLKLTAHGRLGEAETRYHPSDLTDPLQLKRKLYELKGDLLGIETRKSLADLRDILNLSDSIDIDIDIIKKEP